MCEAPPLPALSSPGAAQGLAMWVQGLPRLHGAGQGSQRGRLQMARPEWDDLQEQAREGLVTFLPVGPTGAEVGRPEGTRDC